MSNRIPVRAVFLAMAVAFTSPARAAAPDSPGSSRAAMLIGSASDPQRPAVYPGSATWTIISPSQGEPSIPSVRIDIDIPEQKMHVSVTIRKNTDDRLPATHTIELHTTFANDAKIEGIKDMGIPQLRKENSPNGDAVSGIRLKFNASYYLVGLTRSDTDAAYNLDLLATRPWFDFPLLLRDDKIAKITVAKGESGNRIMAEALSAWSDSSETNQTIEYAPLTVAKPTGQNNRLRSPPILAADIDAWLQHSYLNCWAQPDSTPLGEKYIAQIRVSFNKDGSLSAQPQLVNPPINLAWRGWAESAISAVIRCNPLSVPAQFVPYFEQWKAKIVHFDPIEKEQRLGNSADAPESKFLERLLIDNEKTSAPGGFASRIPLKRQNGTFVVPVSINDALAVDFVVDSGASDVCIPADVVSTLFRAGTLASGDFLGSDTYRVADGSTVPSAIFRIRSLKVGNRQIDNVVGVVTKVHSSLVLGQGFLSRFSSWSIDNQRQLLVLN
jgi:gag-polyprotein putative aspartyl protease